MSSKVRWVLVANVSCARILRDLPPAGAPGRAELVMRAPHSRLRELMAEGSDRDIPADNPDREPGLRRGGALVAEDEKEFVRQIVALLQTHRRAGEFQSLVIVASAPMLASCARGSPKIWGP